VLSIHNRSLSIRCYGYAIEIALLFRTSDQHNIIVQCLQNDAVVKTKYSKKQWW